MFCIYRFQFLLQLGLGFILGFPKYFLGSSVELFRRVGCVRIFLRFKFCFELCDAVVVSSHHLGMLRLDRCQLLLQLGLGLVFGFLEICGGRLCVGSVLCELIPEIGLALLLALVRLFSGFCRLRFFKFGFELGNAAGISSHHLGMFCIYRFQFLLQLGLSRD